MEIDYSQQYRNKVNVEFKNDSRSIAFDYINPDTRVLDVGCACGDFGLVLYHEKKCKVTGIEIVKGAVEIAKSLNVYEEIYQYDLNELNNYTYTKLNNRFDYVFVGDVLEHLCQPQKALTNIKSFLSKEGKIIISVPNVGHYSVKALLLNNDFTYTDYGILDKNHLRFFTFKTLSCLLSEVGLRILESTNVLKMGYDHRSYNPMTRIPVSVKRYIMRDRYSYIYQFVIMTEPSDMGRESLLKDNLEKIIPPERERIRQLRHDVLYSEIKRKIKKIIE